MPLPLFFREAQRCSLLAVISPKLRTFNSSWIHWHVYPLGRRCSECAECVTQQLIIVWLQLEYLSHESSYYIFLTLCKFRAYRKTMVIE